MPRGDRLFIQFDTTTHAKTYSVDVGADDRIHDTNFVEYVQQPGHVHRDIARLRVVLGSHMVMEDAQALIESQAKQEVGDDVLHEDDGRLQIVEHLHLGIDQQPHDGGHVLTRERHATLEHRAYGALLRQEHA